MNVFVITQDIKYSIDKGFLFLKNRNEIKKVPKNKVKNIFVFTPVSAENLNFLKNLNVNVYLLNKYGLIRNAFLYVSKKKLYNFNREKHIDILAFILGKHAISAASIIKRLEGRNSYYENIWGTLDSKLIFNKNLQKDDFIFLSQVCRESFWFFLREKYGTFYNYNKKNSLNTTVNLLYSLSIAYINEYLIKKGINFFQNIADFYSQEKFYPQFSRLIFDYMKFGVYLKAVETYKKLLFPTDFSQSGELKKNSIILISKIFIEKVVHNKNLEKRLNLLLEELFDVEKGLISYKDLFFDRKIYLDSLFRSIR